MDAPLQRGVLPRGIRNHNPGNIRLTRVSWKGQVRPGFDPAFVEFQSSFYGLRALMKVLLTYYRKYGLDTVQSIINRWAPPIENATDHYVHHVARRLGVKRQDRINLETPSTLIALAKAIVLHENGRPKKDMPKNWYEDDLYRKAYQAAMALKMIEA